MVYHVVFKGFLPMPWWVYLFLKPAIFLAVALLYWVTVVPLARLVDRWLRKGASAAAHLYQRILQKRLISLRKPLKNLPGPRRV